MASFSLRSVRCHRAFAKCRASTPIRVIVRLMRTKKISALRTRKRAEKGGTCKQKATPRNALGQRKGARMQGIRTFRFRALGYRSRWVTRSAESARRIVLPFVLSVLCPLREGQEILFSIFPHFFCFVFGHFFCQITSNSAAKNGTTI